VHPAKTIDSLPAQTLNPWSFNAVIFSTTANFPKMISLRLRERMRQHLASLNARRNGLLDSGQRASGPVFSLNEVENFTVLRKAGDEARHDAAERREVLSPGEILDRLDFHESVSCKRAMIEFW
jgi:hypothetical protein